MKGELSLNIFRKPAGADSTGDAIPFYHDGQYHIYSLMPPVGTTVYPDRLRTSWYHSVSENLVDWKPLGVALAPGEDDSPDASGVWTGSVLFGEGRYHAFYTGYNIHNEYQQTICHAVSSDGIKWEKDPKNPILFPDVRHYEKEDWRDPYAFYNEKDGCYWLLISARRNSGSVTRRGCIVLYRSHDLRRWEHYGPLYDPNNIHCPECSEMYRIGENWYLSYSYFSGFVNTVYRVAPSPFGPWRTPKFDGIGGRRFYAAKSLEDNNGRRFYFGWAHDRAKQSDCGEWYWGGAFCIPHEVVAMEDGELAVKLPKEYLEKLHTPLPWSFQSMVGDYRMYGSDTISMHSIGTTAYGFFDLKERSFLMECTVRPSDCMDCFGLLLKSNKDASKCLMLSFDAAMQRVSLINFPTKVDPFWEQSSSDIPAPREPGPDGPRVCEKPFPFQSGDQIRIRTVIDNDMVEIFVGDRIAFTYRSYEKPDYEVGLILQDGNAVYSNISFVK